MSLNNNTYATKKTIAQGMLDIALLTANRLSLWRLLPAATLTANEIRTSSVPTPSDNFLRIELPNINTTLVDTWHFQANVVHHPPCEWQMRTRMITEVISQPFKIQREQLDGCY